MSFFPGLANHVLNNFLEEFQLITFDKTDKKINHQDSQQHHCRQSVQAGWTIQWYGYHQRTQLVLPWVIATNLLIIAMIYFKK